MFHPAVEPALVMHSCLTYMQLVFFKSSVNLKQIFMDKSKIAREKARVKNKSDELHEDRVENLICIGIDGKVSKLVT